MLVGCAPAPTTGQSLAERLTQALAQGENAVRAQFGDPDMGSRWFAGLQPAKTTVETGATSGELLVRTTYSGDRRAAVERLSVVLDESGRVVRATAADEVPLWTTGVITASRARHGSVLSVGLDPAARQRWTERLDSAVATVEASGVVDPTFGWGGGVVVEIPATSTDFAAVSGTAAANTAAATSCVTGTPRIVVNPTAFTQSDEWLSATLTHEVVHVAVESPCSTGTAWVVEGMAESVAAGQDAATAKSNSEMVRAYLAAHGVPVALPQQLVTQSDYALAQVAADQVRATLGPTRSAAFFARGVRGHLAAAQTAQATTWYRAALRAY